MRPSSALLLVHFIFLCCSVLASDKFLLYRILPHDLTSLKLLQGLQLNDFKYGLDFWKMPHDVETQGDVMVSSNGIEMFERTMRIANITYEVAVSDVEKLIRRNEGKKKSSQSGMLKDDPILDSEPDLDHSRVGSLKKAKYPFGDYASYAEMVKFMRTIEFYYPQIAKIVRIGTTHEGKPIEGLKIGAKSKDGKPKRAVWVDGNIHAREWASSHTALYFINQLVSEYGRDATITNYVDSLDFYILPCLNPDGYEYTRSSPIPSVRLWRKNRSPEVCKTSIWGGEKCCQGVDLNRNFRFHWAERGSSYEPCSNIYHGEDVFSEPETLAVKDFLMSDDLKDRVDAFVTLHSYAQLWIYPYSHEEQSYPADIADLRKTARKAINRLSKTYGTQYRMGTGADTLSPASGGSDDWAKAALNVKYVYLIELRPEMELSNGFILHKKELIPTAVETFDGFREVVDAVLTHNGISQSTVSTPNLMRKISPSQRKKQLYRMRLLASQTTSTTEPTTTTSESTTTTENKANRLFARFSKKNTSEEKSMRRLPPMAPPTMSPPVTEVVTTETEPPTSTSSEPSTTTSETVTSTTEVETTTSDSRRTTFGFYTQTKPAAFADPSCRDMRYSCAFWLKHNPIVCQEQISFMKAQCAYTCKFCTSFIKRL